MDETVAIRPRHVVVDLHNNVAGTLGGGKRCIHSYPKTAKTVRVGRRHLDQGNVNRHFTTLEQFLDFAQIDGRVVGAAIIDGIPNVGANEHGVMPEVPSHLRRDIGGCPHGHHVDDFHIVHFGSATDQGFDQSLWLCAAWLNVDTHSGLDKAHG